MTTGAWSLVHLLRHAAASPRHPICPAQPSRRIRHVSDVGQCLELPISSKNRCLSTPLPHLCSVKYLLNRHKLPPHKMGNCDYCLRSLVEGSFKDLSKPNCPFQTSSNSAYMSAGDWFKWLSGQVPCSLTDRSITL